MLARAAVGRPARGGPGPDRSGEDARHPAFWEETPGILPCKGLGVTFVAATIHEANRRWRYGLACWLTALGTAGALVLIPAAAASGSQKAAGSPFRPAAGGGHAAVTGTISTVAGGVGGPGKATTVALPNPCGVSFASGSVYLGDDADIRRISQTGWLTTPAGTGPVGTGASGPLGDGGPAVKASFDGACGVVADHSGNLVIADTQRSRVRVVAAATGMFYGRAMTAGDVYTVAGNGFEGFTGDNGPATNAELNYPGGVAVDAAGNLLIADTMNNRIRVVAAHTGTFYGRAMTAGDIYTLAGGGAHLGDGGPATSARLLQPRNVSVDGAGNILVADSRHSRIRVVAARTGRFYGRAMTAGDIYTIAGNGTYGFSGDGGPAKSAELTQPSVVAVDGRDNLVFADSSNERIRVVAASTGTFYGQAMTAGDIYTIAGDGTGGFSGDGGPATSAEFSNPNGVAVDLAGNVLIADSANHRVRVVAASTGTFYGRAMTARDIYTVAGNGTRRFSGAAGPATRAELYEPEAAAVDAAGNMVIADTFNSRVRVVAASTGTFYGRAMTAGDIYTVAGTGHPGFSGDGGLATSAQLHGPDAVTVDGAGNLVIADTDNSRIRVVAVTTGTFYGRAMTAGHIYTVAGTSRGFSGEGGPATSAKLDNPAGTTFDGAGNLVVADAANNRARVVAASTGRFYGRAMTAGHIYTVAGTGQPFDGSSGDGDPAARAEISQPQGVAAGPAGSLLISDMGNWRVRMVAGATGTFYGEAMTAGDMYTVAGTGAQGSSGDGGPATSAGLGQTAGLAVDGAGNLLIADSGNSRIRVVAASPGTFYGQAMTAGDIYTVAGNGKSGSAGDGGPATSAELSFPQAITVDGAGNLVVADSSNSRIRVVAASTGTFYGQAMTAGDIYTVAGASSAGFSGEGGPATSAKLNFPDGVAVDAAGNLVIADTYNYRIRVVAVTTGTFYGRAMTAGHIYTVAGTGSIGYSGNGGPALHAKLNHPYSVAVDAAGNLVTADWSNNRVRVLAEADGTFYGMPMTTGEIYTVAGGAIAGFAGDGRRGIFAELVGPTGVAVDGAGDLVIADTGNSRIREVTG